MITNSDLDDDGVFVISSSGMWKLGSNIKGKIIISSTENVVFDLNRYLIDAKHKKSALVIKNSKNVKVRNGYLANAKEAGILIKNSPDGKKCIPSASDKVSICLRDLVLVDNQRYEVVADCESDVSIQDVRYLQSSRVRITNDKDPCVCVSIQMQEL